MRIAVMGTGGVGGYFGARLAQSGHEVAFVARGRQLDALSTHGLRVESPLGDIDLPDVVPGPVSRDRSLCAPRRVTWRADW